MAAKQAILDAYERGSITADEAEAFIAYFMLGDA
jgi:hypothetical protein